MKIQTLISLAFSGFVVSCSTPPTYIIPTDFEPILATANENGVTVEEVDSLSQQVGELIISNTEGKKLPAIGVTDLENRAVNLQDQLTSKTIIVSSDIHCAMAFDRLENEFPKMMAGLQTDSEIPPTICLIVKTDYDVENEQKFNAVVGRIKPNFQKLYIISEKEARKINLHYASTRLYLNKGIVENMEFGNWNADNISKELSQNSL